MSSMKMIASLLLAAAIPAASLAASSARPASAESYANYSDRAVAGRYEKREGDWRNGAIVYQVLVDRFAPSASIETKRHLYPSPKVLRRWDEVPTRGTYLADAKLWSHEIDFWGGDLRSTLGKLDYIQGLGADVLYVNPVHLAYTNHKYDAVDFKEISPEFGTRADMQALVDSAHAKGMKVVLDGVFNHMGRNSPIFLEAQANPTSAYRDWFVWGADFPGGARIWMDAENLVELNLENPVVRDYIYGKPDSVVQGYLAQGVDGWRLDVAYDIGFAYLGELTRAAHARKPGSLVVGEIANYPKEWFPHVDAVMSFTLRELILRIARREIDVQTGQRMIERLVSDAGIDNMLKSWLMLDNHDTHRIATTLPAPSQRRLAQVLQFTLPGSPNLYYGSELGMVGAGDPEMRAPMRWDLVKDDNAALAWTRQLIQLRKQYRALRVGDIRRIESSQLLAFERYTDRLRDAVLVLANPSDKPVTEVVLIPDSKFMNMSRLSNLLDPDAAQVPLVSSTITVTVPAESVLVLGPDISAKAGYSPYKRVQ